MLKLNGTTGIIADGGVQAGGSVVAAGSVIGGKAADIAAAATTSVWSQTGDYRLITGTGVTISSFGSPLQAGAQMMVEFAAANTLQESATLVLNNDSDNISIEAGDILKLVAISATVTKATVYRKSGNALRNRPQRLYVRDEKTAATSGGASIAGVQTRVLNTEVENTIPGASLASNQITLPPGEYRIQARAPAYNTVQRSHIQFYNVTAAAIELLGSSAYTNVAAQVDSVIDATIVVLTTTVFSLRHYTAVATATNGLGVNNAINNSIFAEVIVTRLGDV